MNGKIVYRQQFTRCGKERCRKCREGEGHGPYWYAYWNENGRTKSKYIGLRLPPELVHAQDSVVENKIESKVESEPISPALHDNIPSTVLLRIYLLGQFQIEHRQEDSWQVVNSHGGQYRRTRALLGCLLSSPGRRLHREQVLKLLWPDLERSVAANRLNGAVHELRLLLEPERSRPAESSLLRLEHTMLELADSSLIWVDSEAFEQLLREAEKIEKSDASDKYARIERLLEEAVALYKGSYLLEELYAEWAMPRREELQKCWIELHLKLAQLRMRRGALLLAIEEFDRVRATDPLNEHALRYLMMLLTRLHRRGEALQLYQQYLVMLKRDYESEPLPETRSVYETLLQGRIPSVLPIAEEETSAEDDRSIVPQAEIPIELLPVPASARIQPVRPTPPHTQQFPLPFVGRLSLLESMRQALFMASPTLRPDVPHGILLTGAPGIGKTRLVQVLGNDAYIHGWAVLWQHCTLTPSTQPYHLWRNLLATCIPELAEQRINVRKLALYPPELHLMRLLEAFQQPAETALYILPETVLNTLFALSAIYPLLLVLDDIYLADKQSLELLGYLLYRIQQQRIMLLLLCRDDELASSRMQHFLSNIQHKQIIVLQSVPPMTEDEISAMLAHLPANIVRRVSMLAAGNPLFAEALAQHIARTDDMQSETSVSLPDEITAIFAAQLRRLSLPCQALLTKAAHFGNAFTLDQLLMDGWDEDIVLDLLDEALTAKLLHETSADAYITYYYWHPLLTQYLLRL